MGRPDRALQITPYMWAAGLEGSISPLRHGPTIGVEKSFSNVMEDLNFGGFVNIWGRYDRFVFSGDVMYVDTTGGHGTGPLPAMQIPGLGVIPPGANVDAEVDTKQFTATLQGGYRVIDTPHVTLTPWRVRVSGISRTMWRSSQATPPSGFCRPAMARASVG